MDHYESLQVMEKNYVSMERGPSVGAVSYDRAVAGSVAARALHDAQEAMHMVPPKDLVTVLHELQPLMLLEVAAMMDLEALVMMPLWLLDTMVMGNAAAPYGLTNATSYGAAAASPLYGSTQQATYGSGQTLPAY